MSISYKKKNYKKGKHLPKFIILFLSIFVPVLILLIQCDNHIFGAILEISRLQSITTANKVIDKAVQDTIQTLQVDSSDFFIGGQEDLTTVSANTLLINKFCSTISAEITNGMDKISNECIPIPLGMITGIDILSNMGPKIPFSVRPMGTASVDYETSFTSVAINQVNFKIWLNIAVDVKIVNPLRQEKVSLTRKIMLVDTVISGTVPERYLNFDESIQNY